ncbi:hypothetical protein C1645_813058 [Glomus cerebriforme]|uniref:Uncharacterized protein n=1 Tax=Glomus cerebriforme TaxID=658196 RepID=A0A397TLE3_9GLOM|nr:hypothetical protein C1645_813058 [Glomus cerebriforme]
MQIALVHPHKSHLRNQVLTVKRGSSIFFSDILTSLENQLYVELHNFSFTQNQTTVASTKSTKEKIPWLSTNSSIAQAIHQKTQERQSTSTSERYEIKRK